MSRILVHFLIINFFLASCTPKDLPGEPPVAKAGADATYALGAQDAVKFILDGSASHDPDGDSLTFSWTVTSVPEGLDGDFTATNQAVATYLARQAGNFLFELRVSDSIHAPAIDVVEVKVLGKPPVAVAGEDKTVKLGETVQLDASQSADPDGHIVAYIWQLMGKPIGSTVQLGATDLPVFYFQPDKAGIYGIRMKIVDADGFEDIDYTTITVK